MPDVQLLQGDCLSVLKTLPQQSVQTCVTSPPYFGLRDYGVEGQVGLEETPEGYVQKLVAVFREVKRVLRDDGTLWLNLGDSYQPNKQLAGVPWLVAFALQADGWVLRSDIVWAKGVSFCATYNGSTMPESVVDRPTKSHEYLFLFAKSPKYIFDMDAIREPLASKPHAPGNLHKIPGRKRNDLGYTDRMRSAWGSAKGRNVRSVWVVNPRAFRGAHFATYPPDLIRPCIRAGAPKNGVVLDPFNGSGTTGQVCVEEGRSYIGIELNPDYIKLSEERIAKAKAANPSSLLDEAA